MPSTGTLIPGRGASTDFDCAENIFIEGENLEVLKSGLDLNSYIEKNSPPKEGNCDTHIHNPRESGNCGYCINLSGLVLMLEEATAGITDAIIRAGPQKVIALDRSFEGKVSLKTNAVLQMRGVGIDFESV